MKRELYCDVCASMTEHDIDDSDDEGGVLALCMRCGRLHSVPHGQASAKPDKAPPCSTPCRER